LLVEVLRGLSLMSVSESESIYKSNKPQQEGITTRPGYKELFILILQKTSNNN